MSKPTWLYASHQPMHQLSRIRGFAAGTKKVGSLHILCAPLGFGINCGSVPMIPQKTASTFVLSYDARHEQEACADPECFVRGGPTLTILVDEGREYPNTTIAVNHRPASDVSLACR